MMTRGDDGLGNLTKANALTIKVLVLIVDIF